MAGETVITVVGNLVDDPELRFTPSGAAVANFRIASTPRTFDKQSNEWKDGEALFLSCSIWRQAAENVAESLQKGMRVIVANRPKTPIECLDPRVKSLNYLNNILAKCEAIDFDCHEVLMLNVHGEVTEGSGDNIFAIKNGKVLTPPSDAGILEGITRRFVIERLCKDCQVPVEIKTLRLEDMLTADEVFLTGSAAEIIAVTQIDRHDGKGNITQATRISEGEGPITKRLRQKFREIVTSDHVPEE